MNIKQELTLYLKKNTYIKYNLDTTSRDVTKDVMYLILDFVFNEEYEYITISDNFGDRINLHYKYFDALEYIKKYKRLETIKDILN